MNGRVSGADNSPIQSEKEKALWNYMFDYDERTKNYD